ncbi:unnamed protein product [Cladocopium goreaui]|uniref:Uncharacterized protein n=1 Tax=Cladocopium goreaui TaxID=2562237 RepID=A0A9P1GHJ2_9DINO|nr:unnamed protein product [Cladocopium goreaui]
MGYVVTVIDINSFKSVTRAQKFLDAVGHLIKGVMPDIAAEENVTIHFWISFAFLITDTHPYHVWVERNYAERLAEAIRRVDKLATRPIFVSLCKDPRFHGIRSGIQDALSHFGMVRVPRDRIKQIFVGKRGRQYGVIREEFTLGDGAEAHERFAYRVTKDYGNVFYKDYLKMVLGDDFTEVMGYADATAEKCGDVVEMWLGMLDLANMTKSQITFMETKADPGELLAGKHCTCA